MLMVKDIEDNETLEIKITYVLNCFTDYLYHKHASDQIQEELNKISVELSSASFSTGLIVVSKDSKVKISTWQNELFARESILVKEQDKHIEAMEQVDKWISDIKNGEHRDIIVEYLINNRCENTDVVADKCHTTKGNVSNVSKRLVTNIARRLGTITEK